MSRPSTNRPPAPLGRLQSLRPPTDVDRVDADADVARRGTALALATLGLVWELKEWGGVSAQYAARLEALEDLANNVLTLGQPRG